MTALNPTDRRFFDIPTPALVLDAAVLDTNIAHMARAAMASGVSLRPHFKSHKSIEIARRQLNAGAIGISCATLAEAEDLMNGGVSDLLLTSPLAGPEKCARFAALHRQGRITTVVDDVRQVLMLAELAGDGAPLKLAIDVDIGQGRTGVVGAAAAVNLAQSIAANPRVCFAGIQGYAGHVQHLVAAEKRLEAATETADRLRMVITALRSLGFDPGFVSGSGTGASEFDMRQGPYTELQVGSYLLMDAEYRTLLGQNAEPLPFQQSLYVLATVVSSARPGEITVDAGTKALAVNGPVPDRLIGVPAGSRYRFWGDEHGIVSLPEGAPQPVVGTRILISPTHCDPTVNLHPVYYVVSDDAPLSIWRVAGRYRAFGPAKNHSRDIS